MDRRIMETIRELRIQVLEAVDKIEGVKRDYSRFSDDTIELMFRDWLDTHSAQDK